MASFSISPLPAHAPHFAHATVRATIRCAISCSAALAVVLSRIIRLRDSPPLDCLLPWADFANHAPSCTSFFSLSTASGAASVVVRAERDYIAGDEAVVSYGEKGSGELLVAYGFVPAVGSNSHDAHGLRLQVRSPRSGWQFRLVRCYTGRSGDGAGCRRAAGACMWLPTVALSLPSRMTM